MLKKQQEYMFFWNSQMFINHQYGLYTQNPILFNPVCFRTEDISANNKQKNVSQIKQIQKVRKKYNLKKIDPDFDMTQIRKKKTYSLQQKQGRNTASNILRTFSKFLSSGKFNTLFDKLKQTHKIQLQRSDFIQWVQEKVNWVTAHLQSDSVFTKMLLILLKYYLNVQAKTHILTSCKMKGLNKLLTLTRIHTLWSLFSNLVRQQYEKT